MTNKSGFEPLGAHPDLPTPRLALAPLLSEAHPVQKSSQLAPCTAKPKPTVAYSLHK